MPQPDDAIEEIFSLFETFRNQLYIGEPVTSTEHSIQAAMLAESDNQPVHVILAALFHDIGHFIGTETGLKQMNADNMVIGTVRHEYVAGEFLRARGFPQELVTLIEEHVNAKRYRATVDATYVLSPASAKTMVLQGGKMSDEEVLSFRQRSDLDLVLKVREYDERAKDPDIICKPLDHYKHMCRSYLQAITSAN